MERLFFGVRVDGLFFGGVGGGVSLALPDVAFSVLCIFIFGGLLEFFFGGVLGVLGVLGGSAGGFFTILEDEEESIGLRRWGEEREWVRLRKLLGEETRGGRRARGEVLIRGERNDWLLFGGTGGGSSVSGSFINSDSEYDIQRDVSPLRTDVVKSRTPFVNQSRIFDAGSGPCKPPSLSWK